MKSDTGITVEAIVNAVLTENKAKCAYESDGMRITAPGKFEGEPVFAPHYWDLALQGFADSDNGSTFTFKFTKQSLSITGEDRLWFSTLKTWLGRKRTLRMMEDSQGFVHCF